MLPFVPWFCFLIGFVGQALFMFMLVVVVCRCWLCVVSRCLLMGCIRCCSLVLMFYFVVVVCS